MGGRIEVRSTVGVETCFTIVLPRRVEKPSEEHQTNLVQTGQGASG